MASSNADEWYLKIAEQVYGPVRKNPCKSWVWGGSLRIKSGDSDP